MGSNFHAFMFPWFAYGHMTPYLHLANKLAERGHKITYLLPKKAQTQLQSLNLFPKNITFHLLTIPPVNGLPAGTETASDIPFSLGNLFAEAIGLTRDQVEAAVRTLKPDLIFFDLVHWVPEMAKEYNIKSVSYNVISASAISHFFTPNVKEGAPAPDYPSSKVLYHKNDAYTWSFITPSEYKIICSQVTTGLMNCDVILLRTSQEIEGKYCDYLQRQFQRKVLLTGPMFPNIDETIPLEHQWSTWLGKFEPESVVFCALGSQVILEKDQFRELCLGIELTGLPFLVAIKPPKGSSTIQEALPEGFEERVKERGVVWGEWVQQPLILSHKSVGCFVNHCGFGSMWESLLSDCQIVLLPFLGDQILNTRLMSEELEVSVEVPRERTGWFSKESLRDAIKSVMEKESKVGNLVRRNHTKLKETLASDGVMNGYVDKFVEELQNLSKSTHLE